MASKRKSLRIGEKVLLIRAIEAGEKTSDVAKRFGFSRSTVSTIWKAKEKILQAEENGESRKKLKKPKYEELDQVMLSWCNGQRQINKPVSGPILKAKAEKFAQELGVTAFKSSEGWLGKFKQRHHISYGKVNEEPQSVDTCMNVNQDWITRVWPKLREKYAPSDIFKAELAGIFFKLTPDKALKFKGEKCVGGKLSKERITVLVAANMDGTEKRKPIVVGESKNPQCFKNIKQLPVTYKANKSAWMTRQLFEEELRTWDTELKGRKILLLINNCPTLLCNLQNIELAFLPPNTTSGLQPIKQSVVKSLKSHYRRKLLMELVESEGKTAINILHAVIFLSKAWEEVTATTIQNSFLHGVCTTNDEVKTEPAESEDDFPLTEWVKQFNMTQRLTESLQTYIEVDDSLAITASLTDEAILVRKTEEQRANEDETDDSEPPNIKKALAAAKLLERYFLYDPVDPTVSEDMKKIHKEIQLKFWNSKRLQTNVTD